MSNNANHPSLANITDEARNALCFSVARHWLVAAMDWYSILKSRRLPICSFPPTLHC